MSGRAENEIKLKIKKNKNITLDKILSFNNDCPVCQHRITFLNNFQCATYRM